MTHLIKFWWNSAGIVQGHCNQHWVNKVTGKKRTCNAGEGCRAPREEVLQERAIHVVKDVWVGCEELDKLDAQNNAHVVDEVIVDGAGTKMILARSDDGAVVEEEPITRDAWEIRRVYQIKSGVSNTCKVFQKLGYTLITRIRDYLGQLILGLRSRRE